jgi:predicted GIY-YIG superfamily endonuclease
MKELVGNYYVSFENGSCKIEPLAKPRLKPAQKFELTKVTEAKPNYVRDYVISKSRFIGIVYLAHAWEPYITNGKEASHYIGYTRDLNARQDLHALGRGSKLIKAWEERGIPWTVVRVWTGDRYFERKLKNRRNHRRLCPICQTK